MRLDDFFRGVFIGMVVLIVVGLAYIYFAHESVRFEPDDAAQSVSNAPGP